jgi:hypothetical protein
MTGGSSDVISEKTYLDVPFADKDQVKALGARWDPQARAWYVPPGRKLEAFGHWLALWPDETAPQLRVAGLPQRCWKCGEPTMTVVACEEEGQLIFARDDVLQVIASQLTEEDLAKVGAGPLRPRYSRTTGSSYWSNGCIACDALLGEFPLREDFVECLHGEVEFPIIAVARVPLDVLYLEDDLA